MSSDRSAALPASRDRPADSDGLPKGEWARTVEEGGYELHVDGMPSPLVPSVVMAAVLVATLLLCAAWWDRIPEQVAAHTDADGQVTRWEPKTLGSVLVGPLLGASGVLSASGLTTLVTAVGRPRPRNPFADGLGPLIRMAVQNRRLAAAVAWSLLPLGTAICATSVAGWADGSGELRGTWMLGAAMLALPVIAVACLRGSRADVLRELDALEIPLGEHSREDLHRWRIPGLVDDPELPLMVQNQPSNWTLNVAHRTGKVLCWIFPVGWLLLGLALLVGPLIA
ncbi:DUF1648 domain-containing protein [Kocuria palustris]|uniref:DUF1648 domain-containing protein n=1 Tax=Kocuria palustris TaxID=71999 RepID=UPI002468D9A7|nr:DUF1648 domain-containing protein [Kocuria palustris]MDH5151499.1 DUF1648 domain-containing protein [Kocuria palustris]